jgi:hypothetical protein
MLKDMAEKIECDWKVSELAEVQGEHDICESFSIGNIDVRKVIQHNAWL